MTRETVGIGVVGTGFGVRVQIPVFLNTPGAKVVAVCGARLDRAQQAASKFGVPKALDDYRKLVELPEVDLVSVITPPTLHYPVTMAALEAGKHVLCEKPFAMDVREARKMLAKAQERNLVNLVNFEFRQDPARVEMKRLIEEGFLGKLLHVHVAQFSSFWGQQETRSRRWWFRTESGGGWLGASGSHTIDAIRCWFGEISGVSAQLDTVVREHKVPDANGLQEGNADDAFFLLMRFASGASGVLASSAGIAAGGRALFEAYGAEGTLVLEGETLKAAKRGAGELKAMPVPPLKLEPGVVDPHYGPFSLWAKKVVDAVREGNTLAPNFEDGLRSQEVIDAARLSAAQGRWVGLPLA